MKIWVDDVRPAPEGYVWCKSVNQTINIIEHIENDIFFDYYIKNLPFKELDRLELIDIDHDAGDYGPPDYIRILDWLEETGRNYPIRIHSQNPVGVENMRNIIKRNGWVEVK